MDIQGYLYEQLGRSTEAVQTYKSYLEKFPSDSATASIRYRLGKIYFQTGQFRDATRVWNALKNEQGADLWAKMADEQLARLNGMKNLSDI